MIPVLMQPEPPHFDDKVRKRGLKWLEKNGVPHDQPPPEPDKLPPYWREAQQDLWKSYRGVCAYLCVFFEWSLGASSTDHFTAKSRHTGLAYEWSNYRLSCLGANRNKGAFDDVLDPFKIAPETFLLELDTGRMYPNPDLPEDVQELAKKTIGRLNLNDSRNQDMRARHFGDCLSGYFSADHLQRNSPFVHYEAVRQGLL